jgi:hypothetical protein
MSKKLIVKPQRNSRPASSVSATENQSIEAAEQENLATEANGHDHQDEVTNTEADESAWEQVAMKVLDEYDGAWKRLADL